MKLDEVSFEKFFRIMTEDDLWNDFPNAKRVFITTDNLFEKSKYFMLHSHNEVLAFCITFNGTVQFYEENVNHKGSKVRMFELLDNLKRK